MPLSIHRSRLIASLVLALGLLPACLYADELPAQQIDGQARKALSGITKTAYTRKISIDSEKGVYETDAAGLLNWVLQKVLPANLQAIKLQGKESIPAAEDYWATFHNAPTKRPAKSDAPVVWLQIAKVSELEPGDVVAIKNPSESSNTAADAATVMIVDEKPVEEPKEKDTVKTEQVRGPGGRMENKQVKTPPADTHRLYRVVVIDSTKSLHGSDSRAAGTSGVGRGTIWLDIDTTGHPVGIHPSVITGKAFLAPIVLGRAVGKAASATSSESSK